MLRDKVLEHASSSRPYLVSDWHAVHVAGWLKHKHQLTIIPNIILILKLNGNDIITMDTNTICNTISNDTTTTTTSSSTKELTVELTVMMSAIKLMIDSEKLKKNYKFDDDYTEPKYFVPFDDKPSSTTTATKDTTTTKVTKKAGIKTSSNAITSMVGDTVKTMFKKTKTANDITSSSAIDTNDTNTTKENKENTTNNDNVITQRTITTNNANSTSSINVTVAKTTMDTTTTKPSTSTDINSNDKTASDTVIEKEEEMLKEVSSSSNPQYIPSNHINDVSNSILHNYCCHSKNVINCCYDDRGNY
jgi:hypothetical protein